ncbi:MAG: right-handed parallel beta-helix repeat-containing protein, partial [Lentisphaeria bacterium]|nr:right-handed parallel beta-helix repeat-containing protein [Lentisphaeria bacterium]
METNSWDLKRRALSGIPARWGCFMVVHLALLAIALLQSAYGADIHVNAGYAGGNSDGSAERPFVSIAAGLSACQTGDTVLVAEGVYGERDLLVPAGVTVEGEGMDVVTVGATGANSIFELYGTLSDMTISHGSYDGTRCYGTSAEIRSCRITAGGRNGIYVVDSGVVFTVMDCQITSNGSRGVYVGANNVVASVSNSDISHNSNDGIRWDSGSTASMAITNCVIWHNGNDGIDCSSNSTNVSVTECDVAYNTAYGMYLNVGGSNSVSIERSVVHHNNGWGMHLLVGVINVLHCIVYANGGGGVYVVNDVPSFRIGSSLIYDNRGTAGIYCRANSSRMNATLANVTCTSNQASYGVYFTADSGRIGTFE